MHHKINAATNANSVAKTILSTLALLGVVFATNPLSSQEQEETSVEIAEVEEEIVEESEEASDGGGG